MDTDCEVHLVGPLDDHARAERLIDSVMSSLGYGRASSFPPRHELLGVSILLQKNGCWLSVPLPVVTRVLREAPELRVYRAFVENRFDDETHGGELSRLQLDGDPPALVAQLEESFEEEDLVKGGVLWEVALFYLLGFMADYGEVAPPVEPLDSGTSIYYAPSAPKTESPAVGRAARALADALEHEAAEVGGRWQLKMKLAHGSRRVLFLSSAEWSELQAHLAR